MYTNVEIVEIFITYGSTKFLKFFVQISLAILSTFTSYFKTGWEPFSRIKKDKKVHFENFYINFISAEIENRFQTLFAIARKFLSE